MKIKTTKEIWKDRSNKYSETEWVAVDELIAYLKSRKKRYSRRIQSANPNTDVIINVQEANKVSRYNQNKKGKGR